MSADKYKEFVVVGEAYAPEKHGVVARERLRGLLSILTNNSSEIAEAAHLGTAYIGNEDLSPEQLLKIARTRFQIASQPFSRSKGDATVVDA
ncbi:MAG: hypothetical protein AAB937_01345 [Patescibacteria group bacterium]